MQTKQKYKIPSLKVPQKEKYQGEPDWVKRVEFKLDRYNHLMELLRTCFGLLTITLQVVILLKLFNII